MTVLPLPSRGRWVWDARDRTRAVRVAAHPEAGLLNLSVWRDDACVGTVKLQPDEVVSLVSALTDGLAQVARVRSRPPEVALLPVARLSAVERRLADVEDRVAVPPWRRALPGVAAAVGRLRRRRP
jgi:hypothetical protein